jgi:protein-tyrosine phosphatase
MRYAVAMAITTASPFSPDVSTPARALRLEGSSNFRDLGGYAGADGRHLQWRRIFRSDHLADLSADDLQTLAGLGIGHTVDFRGVRERATQSYAWPQFTRHAFMIEPTVVQRTQALLEAGSELTPAVTVELMKETYRSFVFDNADRFARLFQLLLHSDAPLVFHCTAGKDRTGWAAALILRALGVSRDEVMEDYLLTNALYQGPAAAAAVVASGRLPRDVLEVLWRVQAPFLDSALDLVEREHGGMDRYLAEVLGMDRAARAQLAARYLE